MMNTIKFTIVVILLLICAQVRAVQPNVILILVDDMGWADSSTYGSEYYQTPNLTRLAEQGMLFTDAYAASPLCSPTRASIMSGQHPARLRMTVAVTRKSVNDPVALPPEEGVYCGLVESKDHLPLEVVTLAEVLREDGYNTAHIGKWHLTAHGVDEFRAEHQGFDFVIGGGSLPGPPDYYSPYKNRISNLTAGPEGEYLNERLAEESIQWMDSVKGSSKPFYLNLWHYAVHGPIIPKKDLLPKYNKLRDPNADQRCPEMATMLESMDNSVGILLDWLDLPQNRELKENTMILLTSDNGGVIHNEHKGNPWTSNRPLRGGKANTYEGGVRVPWIVSWPTRIQSQVVCGTPVQTQDIYPTVLDLAGVRMPRNQPMDGQSIVPLLKGDSMQHQPIFTDFPHLFGILCVPSTSVRVGDWKLIRFHHAGMDAKSDAFELFDLKRDPSEAINLASYMPQKVAELDRLIEGHLNDTDALLPIVNENFKGNPMKPRSNQRRGADRPSSLYLEDSEILIKQAGNRRVQLLDEQNRPRKTFALVLEGADWVKVENRGDGSVDVVWQAPPENVKAKVLFGWRGGATAFEINDWTMPPCELLLGSSFESAVSFSEATKPAPSHLAEPYDWAEGFNSDFSNPYAAGSFGSQFGINTPGIVTNGTLAGIEGDGFAALNTRRSETNGAGKQFGGMDLTLGTVTAADVTYIFTGQFGWRYGSVAAAEDLNIFEPFTGFLIGGEKSSLMVVPAFNFGDVPEGQLKAFNFEYTTQAEDVGQSISLRLRLVDSNQASGLTQLLTDDWTVTETAELEGAVRLAGIFTDHMVLQADAPVPVWGWAESGEQVSVAFAGQAKTAQANEDGKWQVMLDPMAVSATPRSVVVTSQSSDFKHQLSDVLVGEVWFCAGQSNMRMTVRGVTQAKQEISAADYPRIRFFTMPNIGSPEPLEDANGNWQVCSPQSVANLTATGYFFGRKLHQDLEVPIGLIDISYGGATIATFMDAATVRQTAANELIYRSDKANLKREKVNVQGVSSYCYNAMVAPLVPYAVRGTIWYQGESNVSTPDEYISWYGDYMQMMRTKFRNPAMPFYHVQLAGFINQHNTKMVPETWARFRLAQEQILEASNTGMATAMDIGMTDNIHPKNKQEVGRRLALCALNQTYGHTDLVCEGPRFESLKKSGSKVVVVFANSIDGLRLNGVFGGFEGVLADGSVVELDGTVTSGDSVELDVADFQIERLRYAYANFPICPIVNSVGLPALSFDQPVSK